MKDQESHWTDKVSVHKALITEMYLHRKETEEWGLKLAYDARFDLLGEKHVESRRRMYDFLVRVGSKDQRRQQGADEGFRSYVTRHPWFQMNTRNIVAKWHHLGIVIKVGRGRYKFDPSMVEEVI